MVDLFRSLLVFAALAATAVLWRPVPRRPGRHIRFRSARAGRPAAWAAGMAVVSGIISPTLGLGAAMVALAMVLARDRQRRRQRSHARVAAVVDLIGRLGEGVRSGGSWQQTLVEELERHEEGPLSEEAGAILASVEAGERLTVSLEAVSERSAELVELRMLATALIVLADRGGAAAPALGRLTDVIDDRQDANDEALVQASQATASAALLSSLPVSFAVVLAAVDSDVRRFYLDDLLGTVCVVSAIGLTLLGWLWIDRTIWSAR